ncbi:MAG TPA: tagaturonate reductase [Gemmataceae bacterium]|nr:tagaturonate reductase [Gemmataceae bacterium]
MRPCISLKKRNQHMNGLPDTFLQFGAGNFLRAFADLFIQEANDSGQHVGGIVVVQSTDGNRAEALNRNDSVYHVVVRGLSDGKIVDEVKTVRSVNRALSARTQWDQVLAVATSGDLKYVLSNTTEAGYDMVVEDSLDGSPPSSFPAKLAQVLYHRYRKGLPGLVILPCELIDDNGRRLRELVIEQSIKWRLDSRFVSYCQEDCVWLTSLVDRIVTGAPAEHPLLSEDPLVTVAEPFAFWAISADARVPFFRHPSIQIVEDVKSYSLRKIRILNGAHSALVCKAMPLGIATVREAVTHPQIGLWLRGLLFEEIVPVIEGRIDFARQFVHQVLERFANPFIEHKFSSIMLHHEVKVRTRLVPTYQEYLVQFGQKPPRLAEILQGFQPF